MFQHEGARCCGVGGGSHLWGGSGLDARATWGWRCGGWALEKRRHGFFQKPLLSVGRVLA